MSISQCRIVPAVSLLLALSLCLVSIGCQYKRPVPSSFNQPVTDAYALSGGKITHFTPQPGLPASPADKAMLLACRQLPLQTNTAQSALLVITAGQHGKSPLHAMVVGNRVLMLPGDLATMGIPFSSVDHNFTIYPNSPQKITFLQGTKTALVGETKVQLQDQIIATQSNDLVMTLADMKTVFHERDVQRHQPPFLRDVQIIYDIKDYHR